jgi:hypothetical protein
VGHVNDLLHDHDDLHQRHDAHDVPLLQALR